MAQKTASKKLEFSKEVYLYWYKDILLMRRFEETCGNLYLQQKFGGFCHLYIGQEACSSGSKSALKEAQPKIMRVAQKGIFHKNTASRKVSRLAKKVKNIS